MKRFLMTVCFAVLATSAALAQQNNNVPAAPVRPPPKPEDKVSNGQASAQTAVSRTMFAVINIEKAVVGPKEGQRKFEALRKKMEPKHDELKSQNDELASLQRQLQT